MGCHAGGAHGTVPAIPGTVVDNNKQPLLYSILLFPQELINKCYPGSKITLEFTMDDLAEYFTSIAQAR